jgi:tetratricopeptide (TPR) repeat protein
MENYAEKIQDYIDGLLSEEEKAGFEIELLKNPTLAEEVALMRNLQHVITKHIHAENDATALKSTLSGLSKEYFVSDKKPAKVVLLSRWLVPLAVAASMVLFFVVRPFYTQPAFPIMNSTVDRGQATVDRKIYEKAVTAFNAKDYENSYPILKKLHSTDPLNSDISYYMGLSSLGMKIYERAISELQPLAEGKSVYKEDAAYFTAYAYGKMGNEASAAKFARQVSPTSAYYEKAQKLKK